MHNNLPIAQLVKQAQRQNQLAQLELFNRFSGQMLGLSCRIVGRQDVAEDLLQEAFVKAFKQLKSLKEPDRFAGWFKRIVVNQCMNHVNKQNLMELADNHTVLNSEEETDESYNEIDVSVINKAIDELPNGCRQVLVLYLIEEYKHKEIAEMLNVSVSTVKSQYQYGLKLVRKKVKEVLV